VSVFSEFFLSLVSGDLPEFALSSAGHLNISLKYKLSQRLIITPLFSGGDNPGSALLSMNESQ
jgi:hypothetical protein